MMQTQGGNNSSTMAYGILFSVIAIIALIVIVSFRSQADTSAQSASVVNAAPTVDTVYVSNTTGSGVSYGSGSATITVNEGSMFTLWVYGQATDNNGCTNITAASSGSLKVYRTNVSSGSSCSVDNNDCYSKSLTSNPDYVEASCTGAADLVMNYETSMNFDYFVDPTDAGSPNAASNWTAAVTITDQSAASGTGTTTFEVASTVYLDVTSSVSYGSVALGADSSQVTATLTNTGNYVINANIKGNADMTCTGAGSSGIAIGNAHYSTSTGFAYAAGRALTTSDVLFGTKLAAKTTATSTESVYWLLRMPSTGVGGSCSNTLTFTAVAG